MSFAFELIKEKSSTWRDFQPGKIVSLWDMLILDADAFTKACLRLGSASGIVFTAKSMSSAFAEAGDSGKLIQSLGLMELNQDLSLLDLKLTKMACQRLVDLLKDDPSVSIDEILSSLVQLITRFKDELKDRKFMMIKSAHEQYYDVYGTILGEEVLRELPQLAQDAEEAGNCFALGRYTACVFHLMRVMERCVQKMGEELGLAELITYDLEWQKILNKIRGAVKQKCPGEKDPERVRHESVISHLETVKIAWRNPTMHPKQTYTEEQAGEVLMAVKAFVRNFVQLRGGLE